jgi:hypothetical protein
MSIESTRNYFARVFKNDSTRKGIAALAAGCLIGAITEAVWPSA